MEAGRRERVAWHKTAARECVRACVLVVSVLIAVHARVNREHLPTADGPTDGWMDGARRAPLSYTSQLIIRRGLLITEAT